MQNVDTVTNVVAETAAQLLQMTPDPVPRLRILRDILDLPESATELLDTKDAMLRSKWVSELAHEQLQHGGWARFHTMDTKSKHKIPTTEFGVERAVDVGLTHFDLILARAQEYLASLLQYRVAFPEHEEHNDRWPAGREMFVASTLAQIEPTLELLQATYETWAEIAERAFSSNEYNAEHEWAAHCVLTGATSMRDSYLVINNRYAVTLLGSIQHQLSDRTEKALVTWLWALPRLSYLAVPPERSPMELDRTDAGGWLRTQMILARFRSWQQLAIPAIMDLVAIRDERGLWDFGATSGLRLSENWRRADHRKIDHSVYVLLLMKAWLAWAN